MKALQLIFICAGAICAESVVAQTCAAPAPWNPQPSGVPPVMADLCAASEEVALYCDFLDSAGKNDVIWQFSLVDGFTATSMDVQGATAGFNPVIYLYTAACATGGGCFETGSVGAPLALGGAPAGDYFLAASAAPSDAAGACGTVTIATNGWLPVSLQSFSVD